MIDKKQIELDLESLNNDDFYYGEGGQKYLSASTIKTRVETPHLYGQPQEEVLPFLTGKYFHTMILEPEKLINFHIVDIGSRNTNVYRNYIAEEGIEFALLRKEVDDLTTLKDALMQKNVLKELIHSKGNEYEKPAIATIFGMEWKGKADIVTDNKVIDIKTSGNADKFKWSANDYNYDSQAYIYEQLFGKPVEFYIIDKTTLKLKIAKPSPETILRGREKVLKAIEVYKTFFAEDSAEDITQYIEREEF